MDETPELEFTDVPTAETRITGLKQIIETLRRDLERQVRLNDELRDALRKKEEPLYAYIKAGPSFATSLNLELDNENLKEQVDRLTRDIAGKRAETERAQKALLAMQQECVRLLEELQKRDTTVAGESTAMLEMRREGELALRDVAHLRATVAALETRCVDLQRTNHRLERMTQLQRIELVETHAVQEELIASVQPDSEMDFVVRENNLLRRELVRLYEAMKRAGIPTDERGLPMFEDPPSPRPPRPFTTNEGLSALLATREFMEEDERRAAPHADPANATGEAPTKSLDTDEPSPAVRTSAPFPAATAFDPSEAKHDVYAEMYVTPNDPDASVEVYTMDEPLRQELNLRLAEMDEALARLKTLDSGADLEDVAGDAVNVEPQ